MKPHRKKPMPDAQNRFTFRSDFQGLTQDLLARVKGVLVGLSFHNPDSIGDVITVSELGDGLPTISLIVESLPPGHATITRYSAISITPGKGSLLEVADSSIPRVGLQGGKLSNSNPASFGKPGAMGDTMSETEADALQSEISDLLGHFADYVSVTHHRNQVACAQGRQSMEELVGVPTAELLAATAVRLRGAAWLEEWASRHGYHFNPGQLIHNSNIFVLSGAPGTGKTQAAYALPGCLAAELGRPAAFVHLSTRIRGQGIQGKGASDILVILSALAELLEKSGTPIILFLDEAEAVGASRVQRDLGGGGAQENLAIVDALIVGIDRFFSKQRNRGVFVFATNLSGALDSALQRRAVVFNFRRPDSAAREKVLRHWLSGALAADELHALIASVNGHALEPTIADLISQILVPSIFEAANANRGLDASALLDRAKQLSPTQSHLEWP